MSRKLRYGSRTVAQSCMLAIPLVGFRPEARDADGVMHFATMAEYMHAKARGLTEPAQLRLTVASDLP